jgi:hypothetical protein
LAWKEVITQTYIIEPGQFVVLSANASTWAFWPIIPSNAVKIALGGSRMFDGLRNKGDRVLLYDASGNLIDAVSWGDDKTAFDPPVLPIVAKGHSIERTSAGHDTNTAADWVERDNPTPGT